MRKDVLDDCVARGLVTAVERDGLTLYNYTERTVFERLWSPETLAARGLVLTQSGDVVARPWPKFFNVGEPGFEAHSLPAEVPELSDKHDGSLIIVFWNPLSSRWQCVTRGSWENQQTQFAQAWLDHRSPSWPTEYTYLFELVAPWNRIVLPYKTADMILLGRVHNATGQDCSYREAAQIALELGVTPIQSRVAALDSLNLSDPSAALAEGYVARYSNGLRVKLKYAEYLRLHKLMTGLTVGSIWEALAAGNHTPPQGVPDEFLDWWRQHRDQILDGFNSIEQRAIAAFQTTPPHLSRKEKAALFSQDPELAAILFRMLDGADHRPTIWKRVRPFGGRPFLKADANT